MNLRKHLSYKGLDCSGEYKVLPPTFQGIRSLVQRAGGNEDAVAAAFPPLDFVDDKEHSLVGEFVTELQNCDKVERIELVRQFDSYVKELRESSDDKGKRGTQVAKPSEETTKDTIMLNTQKAPAEQGQGDSPEAT